MEEVVRMYVVKVVFVVIDNDLMIDYLNFRFKGLDVS